MEANSISCDELYFRLLTDGMFSFFIGPGVTFIDCNLNAWQYQPIVALCCLMRGATYTYISYDQVQKNPSLLESCSNSVVGIDQKLRSLLQNNRQKMQFKNVKQWFKNPAESNDMQGWNDFIKQVGLQKVFSNNITIDPGWGGSLLFSILLKFKQEEDFRKSFYVLPTPGIQWDQKLKNINQSGQDANGNLGLFLPDAIKINSEQMMSILLSTRETQFQYLSSLAVNRYGQTYPSAQVLLAIEPLNFVETCSFVSLADQFGQQYQYYLLVCVGAKEDGNIVENSREWQDEINKTVTRGMGKYFLSDNTLFYALYGRKKKEGDTYVIDEKWYTNEYLQGRLYQKTNDPIFVSLAAIQQWAGDQL